MGTYLNLFSRNLVVHGKDATNFCKKVIRDAYRNLSSEEYANFKAKALNLANGHPALQGIRKCFSEIEKKGKDIGILEKKYYDCDLKDFQLLFEKYSTSEYGEKEAKKIVHLAKKTLPDNQFKTFLESSYNLLEELNLRDKELKETLDQFYYSMLGKSISKIYQI